MLPAVVFEITSKSTCKADETVGIERHAIRFATVDLAGDAASIRARLLELAGPWGSDRVSDGSIRPRLDP